MTPSSSSVLATPLHVHHSSSSSTAAVAGQPLGVAVRFFWGDRIVDERYLTPGSTRALRVGSGADCDVAVGDIVGGVGSFELVRPEADGALVRLPRNAQGSFLRATAPYPVPLAELPEAGLACPDGDALALALQPGDLARIELGSMSAEVQLRPPSRPAVVALDDRVDFALLNTTLACAFVAILFVVATVNEASATVDDDDGWSDTRARLVRYLVAPPQSASGPRLSTVRDLSRTLDGARGSPTSGLVGASADPGGPRQAPAGPPRRGGDLQSALATLFEPRGGAAPGAHLQGALSSQLQAAMGQLVAASDGDGWSAAASSGRHGAGPGGGGGLEGGDGFARLGPSRGVTSRFGGSGYGVVPSLTPPRGPPAIAVEVLPSLVEGSMDRELVRRVIHTHRGQLRACYERQLLRAPALAGKVSVRFVIAPTGSVADAAVAGSTVDDAELERCVVARVQAWLFPKPKGGGTVVVTYPFVFQQSGR